jgi:hypothetical protein
MGGRVVACYPTSLAHSATEVDEGEVEEEKRWLGRRWRRGGRGRGGRGSRWCKNAEMGEGADVGKKEAGGTRRSGRGRPNDPLSALSHKIRNSSAMLRYSSPSLPPPSLVGAVQEPATAGSSSGEVDGTA